MEDHKPPSWDDIRGLVDEIDRVCRESEFLRAKAERALKRPPVFPERRREPRRYSDADRHPEAGDKGPPGHDGHA